MKSYVKLFLASIALGGLASCTDLDTDIKSQYTKYPDNPIATKAKFEGCYYYLRNEAGLGRNYWEGVMLQGDELMALIYNNGYYDNGRCYFPTIHKLNPDVPGVGLMSDMMSGISYCNQVIMELGGAEGKDAVVAPVRAIRAFYHFMMMDLYGDVPLLSHTPDADETIERTPRGEVAKWIESELLEIIPDLTENNDADTYGRPNKWMAEALLVKLYINWPVYMASSAESYEASSYSNEKLNDCVKYCDEIIQSGIFEVGKGYRKKFFPDNGVQIKDFIYAMPFDPATLGASYNGGHELDRFLTYKKANSTTPGPWGFVPSKSCAGTYVLTPECAAKFNLAGDERNEMILKGPQYAFDINNNYAVTTTPLMHGSNHVTYININEVPADGWLDKSKLDVGADGEYANLVKGYRLAKYPSKPEDYKNYSRKMSNDIPIFRYADILLTKAEAILRGATATNGATPASLMNEVRDCSGAEHVTGTPTLNELLDERSREFICEMWRRQDLIRYGHFEDDWGFKNELNPGAKTEKWRRVMPIPTGVMDTNTNWKQNTGYTGN